MKTERVTSLKREATNILSEHHQFSDPVLNTEHGLPSAYLLDVSDYEAILSRMSILEGLALWDRAIKEKSLIEHSKVQERLEKWLK